MADPTVLVKYAADVSALKRSTSEVEDTGGRINKWSKGVATAVGAAFAIGAVVSFGKGAVSAAEESEKATAALEQVFRSMGDTTGEAAKAAEEYAGALSKKIGVDDEAIISAQTLLATFGKVSDETGRSAGVFDRATAAAADLAAAGFGSMDTNAKQLGKALQDPVKGLTALGRSGVTFTAQEKDRIKQLVESNRVTEAQLLVLEAVEKQVGGTAEASASSSEKMAVAYGEVQESVGKALLPVLQELMPIIVRLSEFVAKNTTLVIVLAGAFVAAALALKILTIAQLLFNFTLAATPLGLIILGIALLVAAAILLAKNWDKVSATITRGFDSIMDAARSVFGWFKSNWPLLLGILTGPFGLAIVLIIRNIDKIEDGARGAVAAVKTAFNGLIDWMAGLVDRVSAVVGRIAGAMKAPINAVISAWNSLAFHIPRIQIPQVKILGKKVGGQGFGPYTFNFPNIPQLAAGELVTGPTLAMIGEAGPELVLPLGSSGAPIEVRVFIGDQELSGIVRTEVRTANDRTAQTILAGAV